MLVLFHRREPDWTSAEELRTRPREKNDVETASSAVRLGKARPSPIPSQIKKRAWQFRRARPF